MNLSILLAIWLSRIPVIQYAHDYGVLSCPKLSGVDARWQICFKPLGNCTACLPWYYHLEIFNYKICRWFSNKLLKALLVPTENLYKWLLLSGVKKLVFLPIYVDLPRTNKNNNVTKISNTLLYFGRLEKVKGVEYLIKSLLYLPLERKNIKLEIVGDGKNRGNLQELTKKLNLEKYVNFCGHIPREDLAKYINNSLCVVVPSIWRENACLSILESYSFNKPVIATDRGSFPNYIFHGETGLLAKALDEKDLAKKISKFVYNHSFAKRLGENGNKLLKKKHSMKLHLTRLLDIFKIALANEEFQEKISYTVTEFKELKSLS